MINVKTFAGVATVALSLAFGMGSAAASFVTGSATVNGVGQLQFQPVGSVGSPPGDYTGVSFAASSNQFTVGGASSDLSGLAGATGTIKDFTYVPFSSITDFLLILSPSASFDATSISTSSGPFGNGWSADGQFLNLSITGILHLSGFDDTTATLAFAGTFTNDAVSYTHLDVYKRQPEGIDVYFDNVGGSHLQAAIANMRQFGRIAACGAIEQYNNTELSPGPNNLMLVVGLSLTIRGFIVSNHFDMMGQFLGDMAKWKAAGKMKWRETIADGIDKAPDAFIGLFKGENFGKMLVRVGPDQAV